MTTRARNWARPTASAASDILHFWFVEAKPFQWYRRDDAFDRSMSARFSSLHEAARQGMCDAWLAHPKFSLAFIILLDQFSRNMFRDQPKAFNQDGLARRAAIVAIRKRFDFLFEARERSFFYMPFMHSENLADQDLCVRLFKARMPASGNLRYAYLHRDIIERFGRFPHRNKILGRASTPAEKAFLGGGGFNP